MARILHSSTFGIQTNKYMKSSNQNIYVLKDGPSQITQSDIKTVISNSLQFGQVEQQIVNFPVLIHTRP